MNRGTSNANTYEFESKYILNAQRMLKTRNTAGERRNKTEEWEKLAHIAN